MKKEPDIKPGHDYYTKQGLKSLVVYVTEATRNALKLFGKGKKGGMQAVAREALTDYVKRHKTPPAARKSVVS